jgi:hypothetical protein
MNSGFFLASTLFLLFQAAPPTLPTRTDALRNTFVVGTETVIDNAASIDLKADDAHFDAQMQQLKLSRDTLSAMAGEDREKDIAAAASNMIFIIAACHIQAKSGSDTTQCEAQSSRTRHRMMESINKHKNGGTWVDGPPA